MSNRLRLCAYVLAGILLSVAVSSVLYFIAYPMITNTLINQNTIHRGDLVLEKNQELTIDNATYINDGSVILQDGAKLILKNAVLKLNQSGLNYPVYYVELANSAKLEASNSIIASTTSQHFSIYVSDRASVTFNNVNLAETMVFGGNAMTAQNSSLEALTIQGDGSFAVAHSTLRSVYLHGDANVSISNCPSQSAIPISIQEYHGTLSLNQTHFNTTLSAYDSAFFIRGDATFSPNSTLTITAQDKMTHTSYSLENFTLSAKAIFINTSTTANSPIFWLTPSQTGLTPLYTLPSDIGQVPPVYDNQTGLWIPSGPLPPPNFDFKMANRTFTVSKGENITISATVIGRTEGNVSLSVTSDTSQPLSSGGINASVRDPVLAFNSQSPTTFNVTVSTEQGAQSGDYWIAILGKEPFETGWIGECIPIEIIIP